jgi:hypothetical protein
MQREERKGSGPGTDWSSVANSTRNENAGISGKISARVEAAFVLIQSSSIIVLTPKKDSKRCNSVLNPPFESLLVLPFIESYQKVIQVTFNWPSTASHINFYLFLFHNAAVKQSRQHKYSNKRTLTISTTSAEAHD